MPSIHDAKTILKAAIEMNLSIVETGDYDDSEIVIPYLEGAPGIGKTAAVKQAADELKMHLEVVRLSEYEPSEVAGWNIPNAEHTQMTRLKPNWIPSGEVPSIVFFDELPQGHTMCQNVAAQACNERRVGPHVLPDNAVLIAAGNDPKHKAGTNFMPTHLRDRLTFISVEPVVDDLCAYFMQKGVDPRIIGFLKHRPDFMSQFDKDAKSCPSPRSWQRVNTWMKTNLAPSGIQSAVTGSLGETVATHFFAYLKLVNVIPDIDALIANPEDEKLAPIEFGKDSQSIMYAVAASIASKVDKGNIENVCKYLKRMPNQEIAGFVMASVSRKYKDEAMQWKPFTDWFLNEGIKYVKV